MKSTLMLILVAAGMCLAQPSAWANAYGGLAVEGAQAICGCPGAGFVTAGETRSFGSSNYDYLVIRVGDDGDTVWAKRMGTQGYDGARAVCRTTDGGYAVAGRTYVMGGNQNEFSVVRLDSAGELIWARAYGGTGWDEAMSIQPTNDSGFVVAGRTRSFGVQDYDALVLKLDSRGDTVWTRTLGGRYEDYARAVLPASDGGYFVAGSTWSPGAVSLDFMIIKLDANGDTLWERNIGPSGIGGNELFGICATGGGGCAVVGRRVVLGGTNDFLVVKLSSGGGIEWAKSFGGDGDDWGRGIAPAPDWGFYVAGYSKSFSDSTDFLVARLSQSGDIAWAGTFGSDRVDSGCAVVASDNGCVTAGYTNSWGAGDFDVLAIAVDSAGGMAGCPYWHQVSLNVSSPNLPTGTQVLTVGKPTVAVTTLPMTAVEVPVVVTHIWPLVDVEERGFKACRERAATVLRSGTAVSGPVLDMTGARIARGPLKPGIYFRGSGEKVLVVR
ncbi:MAG: hypothetical protein ABIL25_07330 [candidate division WOR-3 bacterium]